MKRKEKQIKMPWLGFELGINGSLVRYSDITLWNSVLPNLNLWDLFNSNQMQHCSYLLSLGQKREGKSLTWSWLSPNQIDSLGRFSYSLLFQIAMVKLIISCNGVIFGKVTGNSLFWIAQIESQEYGKLPWDSIYLILNQICMRLLPSCFFTSLQDSVSALRQYLPWDNVCPEIMSTPRHCLPSKSLRPKTFAVLRHCLP